MIKLTAVAALLVGVAWWAGDGVTAPPRTTPPDDTATRHVLLGHADDRRPSESAADWVRHGDHVAVVRITGDRDLGASPADVRRGEGMTLREVDVAVTEVLWSMPGVDPLPPSLTWVAFGDYFKGGLDERTPMGAHDAPRLEPGHDYVVAVGNADACSGGSADWVPIGGAAQLPFDGGVLGRGELEGRTVGSVQRRSVPPLGADDLGRPVAEVAVGGGSADVSRLVGSAAAAQPADASRRRC